jgi:CHC2 zinc finger
MLLIEDYLERELGIQLYRDGPSAICCCPFHGERTPSLHVYAEDGHAHCYSGSCPRGRNHWRDVVDLVADWEFSHLKTKRERLSAAFAACRERGWLEENHKLVTMTRVHTSPSTPAAVQRHRIAMTIAFKHWRNALCDAQLGASGKQYLFGTGTFDRGLAGPFLQQACRSVGYAPSSERVHNAILDDVVRALGPQASLTLRECGITTKSGKQRLARFVLFACIDPTLPVEERVTYYQARSINAGERIILNPPLRRSFYRPLAGILPRVPGSHILEGPVKALAVAAQGYDAYCYFNGHLPDADWLSTLAPPLVFWSDNEEEGKPGPQLRRDAQALAEERGWDHRLLTAPDPHKDPDEWLKALGPDAFGRALERQLRPTRAPVGARHAS